MKKKRKKKRKKEGREVGNFLFWEKAFYYVKPATFKIFTLNSDIAKIELNESEIGNVTKFDVSTPPDETEPGGK